MPDVECGIGTVKERIRATIACLPYKAATPTSTTMEAVNNSVMMLNSFLPESGLQLNVSPHTLLTGAKLDYKMHCETPFGDYMQTHEEDSPSMVPRREPQEQFD